MNTTSAPKGINESLASLKHCIPKGIPIIVTHSIAPITTDIVANASPPNIIHKIFKIVELVDES